MNLYFNTPQSVFLQDDTLAGIVWDWNGTKRVFRNPENPILPAFGSSNTPQTMFDVMSLGDGYEQAVASGLRSSRLKLSLIFDNRQNKVARALYRFFVGEGPNSIYNRTPAEWFWFRLPEPLARAGELLKFRIEPNGIREVPNAFNSVTLTAEIVESFEA